MNAGPPDDARAGGLSWRSPALVAVAIAAFASLLVSVSYRVDDPDLWQHLAVGRAIWQDGSFPRIHQWTWTLWGTREVDPSWGFEAMLWPFWDRGGLIGLFAWRWLTTAAAFAFLWAAARRMGATGLVPAFVIALAGLTYRLRSDLRPETFSAVLFAAMLWILETRRQGGPDRTPALVALAWLWANTHLSYPTGLALVALYLADEWIGRRFPRRLLVVLLAAIGISFLNPYGVRALAQPFEYLLVWRHEPVFQNIAELGPLQWAQNWRSGLPLLMLGWPLLAIARWRRAGIDRVELVICALFTAQALLSQRFVGIYALAAVPFVSRDLTGWLAVRRPRWPIALRAAGVAAACLAIGPLEWSRWDLPMGVALHDAAYPMRACDFMGEHGIRGRGLNTFGLSGWQVFRFWPERERMPFMDIHVSGAREDRDLYALAQADSTAWRRLDAKHRFDYVMIARVQYGGDRLLDFMDRDTAFTLVFKDDVAALFVRSGGPTAGPAGPFAALAESAGYRVVPAGRAGIAALGAAAARDPGLRPEIRAELEREVTGSPWHSQATSLLANLALLEADWPRARALLDTTAALEPTRQRTHHRLGLLDLVAGDPRSALRRFAREAEIHGGSPALDVAEGRAWAMLGRWDRARAACRRALRRDPAYAEAADSLSAWERRGG